VEPLDSGRRCTVFSIYPEAQHETSEFARTFMNSAIVVAGYFFRGPWMVVVFFGQTKYPMLYRAS
jgi:hypothetical protein